MKRILMGIASAALVAACGSTAENDGAGDIGDRSTYPTPREGYGNAQGRVIANLQFQTIEGGVLSLHDIRTDESVRVLVLSSMAEWCAPCIEEQPFLNGLLSKYGERGLAVVSAMFQDGSHQVPTLEQVQSWKTRHELAYTFVRDGDYVLEEFYGGNPPMNMVIDVDTMEIVFLGVGAGLETLIEDYVRRNLPAAEGAEQ